MKIHRDLGLTQKTAWLLPQKMRKGILGKDSNSAKLAGIIETDETFIGGKARNMNRSKEDYHSTRLTYRGLIAK